jgi:AraC family transcriptional regulator
MTAEYPPAAGTDLRPGGTSVRTSIDNAMPASEILLHTRAGAPRRLADPASIVLSSAGAGWSGLAFEHQHLPAVDEADGYMPWHTLSVQLTPPPKLVDEEYGTHRLAPGDVILRPAGIPGRAGWTVGSEVLNVAVEPAAVAELGEPPRHSRFGPDPVVRHLALALREQLRRGAGALVADGVRTALAAHLITHYAGGRLPDGPRRLTSAELGRVRERIDADLGGELRVHDLAAAVPLSAYHFSRVFKATTGLTPHRYVMRCRAEAARALLTRGVPVESVARRTGFADASHLARHFRREFGASPTALR